MLFVSLASNVPSPGFKWTSIWTEQLNTHRRALLNVLKFDSTDSVYTEMVQCRPKALDGNEFDSIKVLIKPADRANRLYEVIETRTAKTILTLIEILENYPGHQTLAAELRELYNKSVKLYNKSYS